MTSEAPPTASGGVLSRSCAEHTSLLASLPVLSGTPQRGRLDESEDGGSRANTETIVVIDYGGQYSQLIARRVRECGVFSELVPHHVPLHEIAARRPRGIILSGGPASVYAPD